MTHLLILLAVAMIAFVVWAFETSAAIDDYDEFDRGQEKNNRSADGDSNDTPASPVITTAGNTAQPRGESNQVGSESPSSDPSP